MSREEEEPITEGVAEVELPPETELEGLAAVEEDPDDADTDAAEEDMPSDAALPDEDAEEPVTGPPEDEHAAAAQGTRATATIRQAKRNSDACMNRMEFSVCGLV